MHWNFSQLHELFSKNNNQLLLNGKWGLEKEALRVKEDGTLALTPHPDVFGDKIENPFIKTDFSESQIELVTPVYDSIEKTFEFLYKLQSKVESELKDELLWPLSMPGNLPDDEAIPLARYDNSEEGKKKEIYRAGLALRYGKKMQMISGIHYNFSFHERFWDFLYRHFGLKKEKQDFINEKYFGLVRNFLRYRWLLYYVFGASPIADESYTQSILEKYKTFDQYRAITFDLLNLTRHTTSLRMSPFGYDNTLNDNFLVSYNSIEKYIKDLRTILSTKSEIYSKLGLHKDGRQIQLNDRLLQLENEYYSPVRFKQIITKNETQLNIIEKNGIRYIEIRIFDLSPFEKTGINLEQMYFTHVFILFCLFEKSDLISDHEAKIISQNSQLAALKGRLPELKLAHFSNETAPLQSWGKEIFKKLKLIAKLIDKNSNHNRYERSIENQFKKLFNSALLPSSKIINEMKENHESYPEFGIRKANENLMHTSPYGSEKMNTSFLPEEIALHPWLSDKHEPVKNILRKNHGDYNEFYHTGV